MLASQADWIGRTLGPYQIVAHLGHGGMGVVYRALDPRLGREVAVKILPERFAADADALSRFEREARAVAALSHPNILAIFDVGRDGETRYAAMELLDGETLRERLESGPLPVRKAIDFAAQIAGGLAAAHERGIVHRDLKPENLFVTRDGRVKILDFGLARQGRGPVSASQVAAAPTRLADTEPGAVLGTVGYMSPEQVRGEPADARSDIFSLGAVLYEMLVGRRAFVRESAVETMAAIVREEPADLEALGETLPPGVDRLLRHCLEKRPGERFQSARDLAFDLSSFFALASSAARSRPAALGVSAHRVRAVAAGVGLLALGAALGYLAASRGAGTNPGTDHMPPPAFRQLTRLPGGERWPAIFPDGESFVFVKEDGGDLDLFTQRVDGHKAIQLTPDCARDDTDPAVSPDGRWIAFRSDCDGGGVFVMGATGESRRRVTDQGAQPAWSPDGQELAVVEAGIGDVPTDRGARSRLWAVRVTSGERRLLSEHDAMQPSWSPNGQRIAFWGLKGDGYQRDVWTVAADGSESALSAAVALTDDPAVDWSPRWSPDGRSLFYSSSRAGTFNIWRLPIDETSGRSAGRPEPLTAPSSWAGPLSVSADGRRIVWVDRNAETALVKADLDLRRRALIGPPTTLLSGSFEVRDVAVSPDGGRLLFANEEMPQQMHLIGADGKGYRQLTEGPDRNRSGVWSPDGQKIAFQTTRGNGGLAIVSPDGGGWQSFSNLTVSLPLWSPDGKWIAVLIQGETHLLTAPGRAPVERRALPRLEDGRGFIASSWSPDGRFLLGAPSRQGLRGGPDAFVYSLADQRYRFVPVILSALGPLVAVSSNLYLRAGGGTLVLGDLTTGDGVVLHEARPGHSLHWPSASHDGHVIAWIDRADESDIWLMELSRAESKAPESP